MLNYINNAKFEAQLSQSNNSIDKYVYVILDIILILILSIKVNKKIYVLVKKITKIIR